MESVANLVVLQTKDKEKIILAQAVTADQFEAPGFGKKSNSQKNEFALYDRKLKAIFYLLFLID
jgi:hypothetical protein